MAFRIWLFISGLAALSAVAAAAYGAHGLNGLTGYVRLAAIYETAQRFHMIHALALFGAAILMAATEGRRNLWGGLTLNLAALCFLTGILMFSGGIYYQVLNAQQTGVPIVPLGGGAFMVGWAAIALSVFGYRTRPRLTQPS